MVGVYKITNLVTGKSYVGKSVDIEKRWKDHFSKGYGARHSKSFQDAIDQCGAAGFMFHVLEECEPEQLHERERYWIKEIKPEYNTVTDGHEVTPETRAKISASLTGRKQPPELVEKRRKALLERHKRIPQTNEGHRKKVAIQMDEVVEFQSVKSLAEFLGVHPSSVTKSLKKGWKVRNKKVWYVV